MQAFFLPEMNFLVQSGIAWNTSFQDRILAKVLAHVLMKV